MWPLPSHRHPSPQPLLLSSTSFYSFSSFDPFDKLHDFSSFNDYDDFANTTFVIEYMNFIFQDEIDVQQQSFHSNNNREGVC